MKRCKNVLTMLGFILLTQLSFGQLKHVKFEQLDSLQNEDKRPIVVFLHTSWCKYCGTMKNTTLKNTEVIGLLNQSFYFISLDIEQKETISFRGHKFRYKPTGATSGVHELAEQLGIINGEMAYPGISFLNPAYEIIYQQEGFIDAREFTKILKILK